MRHATWLRIENSPFWYGLYRQFRRLPPGLRAPLRALMTPRWHLLAFAVRRAARGRAVAGPFQGMHIELSPLSARHHLGYLLGSQELELREAIARIAARPYRTVLNIGAADGYYAVGLALRQPLARVEAFEALPEMHPLIARTAAANGVAGRIAIRGTCTAAGLAEALAAAEPPVLIVIDIEGGEVALLDPQAIAALAGADILVETHDGFVAGATETLIERFHASHEIDCYTARPRSLADFPAGFLPAVRRWFPGLAVELMNERRAGGQRWLLLTARPQAAAPQEAEAAASA